jgi:hypothetical protein
MEFVTDQPPATALTTNPKQIRKTTNRLRISPSLLGSWLQRFYLIQEARPAPHIFGFIRVQLPEIVWFGLKVGSLAGLDDFLRFNGRLPKLSRVRAPSPRGR